MILREITDGCLVHVAGYARTCMPSGVHFVATQWAKEHYTQRKHRDFYAVRLHAASQVCHLCLQQVK